MTKCNLQRDRHGIFASVAPIPDAVKHFDPDLAAFLAIVGIDAGLVSVTATVSARPRQGLSVDEFFSKDQATGKGFTEARLQDYRYRSMMKRAQRFEDERANAKRAATFKLMQDYLADGERYSSRSAYTNTKEYL